MAYVESYEGERIILTHPLEDSIRERVLNIPRGTLRSLWFENTKWWWSKKRKDDFKKKKSISEAAHSRCGFLSDCICVECMKIQRIDFKKDKRECSQCSSINVKSITELLGDVCPKCKQGHIVEIETGIWS